MISPNGKDTFIPFLKGEVGTVKLLISTEFSLVLKPPAAIWIERVTAKRGLGTPLRSRRRTEGYVIFSQRKWIGVDSVSHIVCENGGAQQNEFAAASRPASIVSFFLRSICCWVAIRVRGGGLLPVSSIRNSQQAGDNPQRNRGDCASQYV